MKAIYIIAFILFIFLLPVKVFAVTVNISDYPQIITDEPFNLTASISGASSGNNYLRIDIYKDGTTNYFGETYNGSDWFGGSTFSQYFPITIQSGVTWNGTIQGRVGSPTTGQYDGTGSYKLRIRRYTSGGGYTTSEANNSSVLVSINLPTPSPTLFDSPTPTNTPTPTVKPTTTPTPKLTSTTTPTPIEKGDQRLSLLSTNEGVLSLSTKSANNPSKKEKSILIKSDASFIPKAFMLVGIVIILICVILVAYPFIKQRYEW